MFYFFIDFLLWFKVAIGDASDTMLCKKIIHINSPSWNQAGQASCVDELTKSVNNIFTLCETNGIKTVALPSISSGGYLKIVFFYLFFVLNKFFYL
jgi:hypothetical protein